MGTIITEIKTIKTNCDCVDNPVYIAWLGTNGGYNYWLFDRVQAEVELVSTTAEFFPYNNDIETALGNGEVLKKESQPQLIVGGYIDKEDLTEGIDPGSIPGLKGLLRSIDILMLMNNDTWETEGPRWMRVKIVPGTFKIIDTNQTKAQIEITFLMPTINIQSQ